MEQVKVSPLLHKIVYDPFSPGWKMVVICISGRVKLIEEMVNLVVVAPVGDVNTAVTVPPLANEEFV